MRANTEAANYRILTASTIHACREEISQTPTPFILELCELYGVDTSVLTTVEDRLAERLAPLPGPPHPGLPRVATTHRKAIETLRRVGGHETPHGAITVNPDGTWVAYGHLSTISFIESYNWARHEVTPPPPRLHEEEEANLGLTHHWAILVRETPANRWRIHYADTITRDTRASFPITLMPTPPAPQDTPPVPDDLTRALAALEETETERARLQDWQNKICRLVPEVYEACEGSQESCIDAWLTDLQTVAAPLAAELRAADETGEPFADGELTIPIPADDRERERLFDAAARLGNL